MQATNPASFVTALPLSTAGRVFFIHEKVEGGRLEVRGGELVGLLVDHCIVHGNFTKFVYMTFTK